MIRSLPSKVAYVPSVVLQILEGIVAFTSTTIT
jgi:hypothetical protein